MARICVPCCESCCNVTCHGSPSHSPNHVGKSTGRRRKMNERIALRPIRRLDSQPESLLTHTRENSTHNSLAECCKREILPKRRFLTKGPAGYQGLVRQLDP